VQPDAGIHRSLAEIYGQGAYAPYLCALRQAGSGEVALVRFRQPAGAYPDPPTADYTLALNEQGSGRMSFDIGLGRRELPFRRGDLVLKAPGTATQFANDGPHAKSFVSLPAAMVQRLAADAAGADGQVDFRALHDGAFRSPMVLRLFDLMWSAPMDGSPEARLFQDGAVLALVATLLRLAAPGPPPAPVPAALSPARIARVRDYVQARLGDSIGLEDMAAVAGLSVSHFSRAFKRATGQSPRAFVTACRVDQAKLLLGTTALPLAQVAQTCGFADQAHFTTVFSRTTGSTPGAWRRARG
jgi:AraC family transcriptional regulator